MIKIEMVQGNLKFTVTRNGLATLTSALQDVMKVGEVIIPGIIFRHAGEERVLNLAFDNQNENSFKVTKQYICLSLDSEDIEHSLLRFEAEKKLQELYPEWFQAVNLTNKKNTYIYISMQAG